MRRVRPLVEVDGKEREMEFLTNNLCWSASSLYRCRWQIEVFFKQIKQSLQFAISTGNSANAVRWQVWTALLRNSEDCFDIPNKRAPSSLPPRAERLDACLVLGYKFRYRESILLIFRKRNIIDRSHVDGPASTTNNSLCAWLAIVSARSKGSPRQKTPTQSRS
jgi:hypothetical protein